MRRRFIAAFFQRSQAVNLCRAHRRIIDLQHIYRIFIFKFELIDPDHSLATAINGGLGARGGFLNAHFRNALLNGCRHATQFLDFLNMAERTRRQIMRQFFNEIAAAPRVDDFGGVAFHLQHKLRVARDTRREIGRQGQRFVKTVCVQRLRMPLCRAHCLNAGAHDVVVNILRCQAPTRGLTMGAQSQRFRVLRAQALHELRP